MSTRKTLLPLQSTDCVHPLGEILQPQLKKKKTLAAPKARDLRSRQVDKYCLQHQEEDSEGDVETKLYKVGG